MKIFRGKEDVKNQDFDFEINVNSKGFGLVERAPLPAQVRSYLLEYLSKLSSYRPIGYFQGSPVYSLYQTPPTSPAGIRALKLRLQRKFLGVRLPAVATLAINRACQCSCEHCSAVFYNVGGKPELSFDQWRKAIAQSSSLGVTQFIFVGGEPLLYRNLGGLLASIDRDKAGAILFTNGEFLAEDNAKSLSTQGLLGAFVSIDSARAEEHDRLRRRPGLFAKALEGIRVWRKVGVLVGISSYLSPSRLAAGVFQEIMELGKKLRVNEVTFFDAIPSGSYLHDEKCMLQASDRSKIRELVRAYRRNDEYPRISAQSMLTSEGGSAFCFAANTQFYLSAGGEMCPCDFTPLSIGKFPEEDIETLWGRMIHSPPYHCRAKSCRMQDPDFRKLYIHPIPVGAPLPWPLRCTQI